MAEGLPEEYPCHHGKRTGRNMQKLSGCFLWTGEASVSCELAADKVAIPHRQRLCPIIDQKA